MKLRRGCRSGFTLIELLVVMAIIGILSGLIFMAISKVQMSAKKTKAKVQIKHLEKAFVTYYDEYGEWPSGLIVGESAVELGENAAYMLRGENINDFNPQLIRFFGITDSQIRIDNDGVKGFVDPWNYCYKYIVDFNDDGILEIPFMSGVATNAVKGLGVAVWSQGPDGDDQKGEDNVTSWKVQ